MLKRALLLLGYPRVCPVSRGSPGGMPLPRSSVRGLYRESLFLQRQVSRQKNRQRRTLQQEGPHGCPSFPASRDCRPVTNLSNGRHLLVRINDRGPIKKSWILDVSREAASRLNMIRRGIAPVQVEVVADKRGHPVQRGTAFFLKVGEVKNQREGEAESSRFANRPAMRFCIPENAAASQVSARLFTETTLYGETRLLRRPRPLLPLQRRPEGLRQTRQLLPQGRCRVAFPLPWPCMIEPFPAVPRRIFTPTTRLLLFLRKTFARTVPPSHSFCRSRTSTVPRSQRYQSHITAPHDRLFPRSI